MSEHTPGPWKVDSKYCVGPVSQEDDQSYGMIIPVADVYGQNRQADAELIASAPQLREQNRVLRGWLEKALDHAHQHNEGCLYCGRGEIIDGETTPEHRAECWWYRAKAALTATSRPAPPYKEWCRHPEECAGLASCPRNPTCAD